MALPTLAVVLNTTATLLLLLAMPLTSVVAVADLQGQPEKALQDKE